MTVDESSRRKRSKDVAHVLRMKPYKDPGQQDNPVASPFPSGKLEDASYFGCKAAKFRNYPLSSTLELKGNYIDVKIEGKVTRALVDLGASYFDKPERFRLKLRKIMFAEPMGIQNSHQRKFLEAIASIKDPASISHSWDKQSSCNLVVPIPSILNQNFKIQLIEVTSHNIPNDAIVVAECQKGLLLERELMSSSSVISLFNNR
ncbi:hypothetical protein LAZ67_11002001, partial [Cordylochernes scorpioides]